MERWGEYERRATRSIMATSLLATAVASTDYSPRVRETRAATAHDTSERTSIPERNAVSEYPHLIGVSRSLDPKKANFLFERYPGASRGSPAIGT
jgi:hypothetical protein